MPEKWSGLVIGPKSRWVTLIIWIVLAVILTVLLPPVKEMERNNAPNLEADSPSVVADRLIKEQFPGSSGVPALVVWHREGGLTTEDFALIRKLSASIADKPLEAQVLLSRCIRCHSLHCRRWHLRTVRPLYSRSCSRKIPQPKF